MKIIQFTDPHIGGHDQDTHGVDTRANFVRTLEAIKEEQADAIVLSGDLCFKEPRQEIYDWIAARLDDHGIEPLVIPGNHDDTELLCDVMGFEATNGELYFEKRWDDARVLFLDSSKAEMSDNQWKWLKGHLDSGDRTIIFTHYPPIKAFVPYMDNKHDFKEEDRFIKTTASSDTDVHVFCGHYHVAKSISRDHLHVHITPSGFFQIRDDMQDFGVDHYRIGYRIIRLDKEVLAHGVRYI